MRHFTTVCDSNYLAQGLALYLSLMKVNPDFILFWLCIDQKAYEIVSKLNLKNVILDIAEPFFPVNGFNHKEYCWSLASRYTDFIFKLHGMPNIVYLDADLYFYQDYEHIYKEIGDKSIGIIEHRIPNYKTVGKYNVAFNYFKNDEPGKECLNTWQRLASDKNNEYFKEYGSCGDQKYLELFMKWYPLDVHIIDCGHGAWWNNRSNRFYDECVIYDGKDKKLIFMHYSHFNLTKDGYTHDEMKEMSPRLREYYDNYEKEVRKCEQQIQSIN
jgi:hypothetical protein